MEENEEECWEGVDGDVAEDRDVERDGTSAGSGEAAEKVDSGIESMPSVSTGLGVAVSRREVEPEGSGLACLEKGPSVPKECGVEKGMAGA